MKIYFFLIVTVISFSLTVYADSSKDTKEFMGVGQGSSLEIQKQHISPNYGILNVPSFWEQVATILSIVGSLSVMSGLFLGWLHLRQLRKQTINLTEQTKQLTKQNELLFQQTKDAHEYNRRKASFDFSFEDDPKISEILNRLNEELEIYQMPKQEVSRKEIQNARISYKGKYQRSIDTDINYLLSRLERFAVALDNKVIDAPIGDQMLKGKIIRYHHIFTPYIKLMQKEREDRSLFELLETCVQKFNHKDNPPPPSRASTGAQKK